MLEIYLRDHRAGASGGAALANRVAERYAGDPGYAPVTELAAEIGDDRDTLERLLDALNVSGGLGKRALALLGERLGRLKPNGHIRTRSPLSRLEELEMLSAGIRAKARLWAALDAARVAPERFDMADLRGRAERQLDVVDGLQRRAAIDAFVSSVTHSEESAGDAHRNRADGVSTGMSNPMSDDDITRDGPTEDDENLDAPGEHSKDTGDEA